MEKPDDVLWQGSISDKYNSEEEQKGVAMHYRKCQRGTQNWGRHVGEN